MTSMVVIAIDDTDMPETRGTGRLARELGASLERAGLGHVAGVTRHQFHVGPGVPMTSHNSAAAVGIESESPLDALEVHVRDFMEREFIPGSDPGMALLDGPAPGAVVAFARRAQRELVTRTEAERLSETYGLRVRGLGGTRDGIIGAMSAAALRWDGNDGRFVGLPAIRDLMGLISVAEAMVRAPIAAVVDEETSQPLAPSAILDTGNWVRPRLIGGQAIVVAKPTETPGVWINVDKRTHED